MAIMRDTGCPSTKRVSTALPWQPHQIARDRRCALGQSPNVGKSGEARWTRPDPAFAPTNDTPTPTRGPNSYGIVTSHFVRRIQGPVRMVSARSPVKGPVGTAVTHEHIRQG
jgi:hypothetical protein